MKKIFILIIAVSLFGCHNYKQDAENLLIARDSLQQESITKDSAILGYLTDMNEIQSTLDTIKKVEKLVMVDQAQMNEMTGSQRQRILEDLGLLQRLLDQNKEQISSLQSRLNRANAQIGSMEEVIAEFETMVANLTLQVEEKDAEIAQLRNDIYRLQGDIELLNREIEQVKDESAQKSETIQEQVTELNKAYYTFGTVKELKENGVIDREGGFLGLGRATSIKEDLNSDYFTEIDIREFKSLQLLAKKATIVSVHPEGSYHITGENTAETFFIDDYQKFWEVSKYLVIVVNE